MSGFKTKIDLGDNIFIEQGINKTTKYSGSSTFGVPMNERKLGPNYEVFISELSKENIKSNFIWNKIKKTITIEWGDAPMHNYEFDFDDYNFYSETPTTLKTKAVGIKPYIIDEVTFFNNYTWYEFDILPIVTTDVDTEEISGYFETDSLIKKTSESLDYKGDNTIIEVIGDVKCENLIGSVNLTCVDIITNTTLLGTNGNYFITHTKGDITFNKCRNGFYFFITTPLNPNNIINVTINETVHQITITDDIKQVFYVNNKILIK